MILRLLILVAAAYILYRLFMGDQRKKQEKTQQEHAKRAESGEMVKDPACGAYVPVDTDIRVKHGATVHRFCSYECRDRFLKEVQGGEKERVE
jgi:YHS domain-containing protein